MPYASRPYLQAMPAIAMGLVVALLVVLLWVLDRNEREETQHELIQGVLWVEQNIHFNLQNTMDKVSQLALEDTDPGRWHSMARHLIENNPELDQIVVLDAAGRWLETAGTALAPAPHWIAADTAPWQTAFRLAQRGQRPVWSPVFSIPGIGPVFALLAPRHPQGAGGDPHIAMAIFSLNSLLDQDVPWWVVEKYKIQLEDQDGQLLASKTKLPTAEGGLSHRVRLDPPGNGLMVSATLYGRDSNLGRNVLVASIFILATLAVSSLWALRRHAYRRLLAEREVRSAHAFRKAMEDSLTVGMRARDLQGRVTYVNPAFCRMVGWDEQELVGVSPPMPYWVPELMAETFAMHRQVMAGEAPPEGFELQFRRKNGDVFWALVYEAPLIGADGRQTGWMASVLDLTERKRAEETARLQQEQIQRTGRLITMGELASTLAHELNQPLSAIASYNTACLNLLNSGQWNDHNIEALLGKVGAQAQRAGQIVRRVHDFVRKSEPRFGICSLNVLVSETVSFMEMEAKRHNGLISVCLDARDPQVKADRILIEQVLLNLSRNGLEAMAGKPNKILQITVSHDDQTACVTITDRGLGITQDQATNLFQPFFTTKEDGMGMGLNICRTIIETHQGRLWFDPAPGGGSMFTFSLPLQRT